jgi:hypothetical protein
MLRMEAVMEILVAAAGDGRCRGPPCNPGAAGRPFSVADGRVTF